MPMRHASVPSGRVRIQDGAIRGDAEIRTLVVSGGAGQSVRQLLTG